VRRVFGPSGRGCPARRAHRRRAPRRRRPGSRRPSPPPSLGHHGVFGVGVEAPHGRGVDPARSRDAADPVGVSVPPRATTWLRIATPSSASSALARAPAATRAAVSRPTRARGRHGRRRSLLLHAARSAWPGRAGWDLRRRSGAGDISSTHLGHSVLRSRWRRGNRGCAVPDAGEEPDLVHFEPHAVPGRSERRRPAHRSPSRR